MAKKPTKRAAVRSRSENTDADLRVQHLRRLAKDVRRSINRNRDRGEALAEGPAFSSSLPVEVDLRTEGL